MLKPRNKWEFLHSRFPRLSWWGFFWLGYQIDDWNKICGSHTRQFLFPNPQHTERMQWSQHGDRILQRQVFLYVWQISWPLLDVLCHLIPIMKASPPWWGVLLHIQALSFAMRPSIIAVSRARTPTHTRLTTKKKLSETRALLLSAYLVAPFANETENKTLCIHVETRVLMTSQGLFACVFEESHRLWKTELRK